MSDRIQVESSIILDPEAPFEAKVDAAAALWELAEACEHALEPFKREARERAALSGESPAVFNGSGMSQCRVVTPKPSLKLRKGLTVEGERAVLGPLFDVVYEVSLSLRNASQESAATLPPEVQKHLASVAIPDPGTPRVSLKSLPGVVPVRS